MRIEVLNHSKSKMPRQLVKNWLKACTNALPKKDQKQISDRELVVVFVSRPQIKRLNRDFRGKNEPTDILSFESLDEDSLGELVLSLDVVRAQSKRTGLSYHQELCYMLLHGLLHLLGYDHETSKKEAKIMFNLQNRIFESLARGFDFR